MNEPKYQIYYRNGDICELLASDMSIEDALVFVGAWHDRYYNDEAGVEVRRQRKPDE